MNDHAKLSTKTSENASTLLRKCFEKRRKYLSDSPSPAVRLFYGPGEGSGALQGLAVDRFGDHFWLTFWDRMAADPSVLEPLIEVLREVGAVSVVGAFRDKEGAKEDARVFFGTPPDGAVEVEEVGGRFEVRFKDVKHPGLFLDHEPLRRWLRTSGEMKGRSVLNAFAYTGSLSVAAGLGGAFRVVTLDLSRPTIEWARRNWDLNGLSQEADFIYGDVFEWFPKLLKRGDRYDCVILDPPSFSRGKRGVFSTSKDLVRLHEQAMALLGRDGILITSINSENVTRQQYDRSVQEAADRSGMRFVKLREFNLPDTFPVSAGDGAGDYLKGWILRRER